MARLTVETIDQVIEAVIVHRAGELDLRHISFIDPYALLLLGFCVLHRREEGGRLAIQWPRSSKVRRWMEAMGFFNEVGRRGQSGGKRGPTEALQPITAVSEEERIGQLVDAFERRLSTRYPLTVESRGALVKIMLELFQNIPQHANATGEVSDPHGLAAMQDYSDSIFLSVGDMGVGLRGSLSLREGFASLSDKSALNKVVFDGMSRFTDPGRGGELRRIARLIHAWDGLFVLRSGEAMLYMDPERGDVYDAPPFPGVQIAIRLPRAVFGIEPPPVDNTPFLEFNERNERASFPHLVVWSTPRHTHGRAGCPYPAFSSP